MKQEDESPIQLSSQERLIVLEEQELEKVMGAGPGDYPGVNAPHLKVPLLSDFQHSAGSRDLPKLAQEYLSKKFDFAAGTKYHVTDTHIHATPPGGQTLTFKRPGHI